MAAQPASPMRARPFGEDAGLSEVPRETDALALNPTWRRLLVRAEVAAPRFKIALIEGGTGTGKQTLARFLHSRSPLAKSPFRRHDAREWLATEADPGATAGFIYLDRIDLLAASGQSLLLNTLKSLEARPAGRTVLVASARVPLERMAREGKWMPDLALRLTAIRFALPLLGEQRAEIVPLVNDLLARFAKGYRQQAPTLGPGVLDRLLEHDWPGNLRELVSALESAFLASGDGVLRLDDLPLSGSIPSSPAREPTLPDLPLSLERVIHDHVHHVLALNHGNKQQAARQLGISRSTLYRILHQKPFASPTSS